MTIVDYLQVGPLRVRASAASPRPCVTAPARCCCRSCPFPCRTPASRGQTVGLSSRFPVSSATSHSPPCCAPSPTSSFSPSCLSLPWSGWSASCSAPSGVDTPSTRPDSVSCTARARARAPAARPAPVRRLTSCPHLLSSWPLKFLRLTARLSTTGAPLAVPQPAPAAAPYASLGARTGLFIPLTSTMVSVFRCTGPGGTSNLGWECMSTPHVALIFAVGPMQLCPELLGEGSPTSPPTSPTPLHQDSSSSLLLCSPSSWWRPSSTAIR